VLKQKHFFGIAVASLMSFSSAAFSDVTVTCPAAVHVKANVSLKMVYIRKPGDPVATSASVFMAANVSEQLGGLNILGPWFRPLTCPTSPCTQELLVDQVPATAANNSIIFVGASVLNNRRKEIGQDVCQIRVLNP
jgi:hypothetical protein